MRSEDKDITAGKYNILIIDDNPDMLLFLQSSLKDIYNIFPANSGKNALQRLKNIPQLDFILLNVNIHDMDGYELLVSLSGSEEYGDIPIVLLSTKSSTKGSVSDKIKGLSGGAVDYISMPVVIEELIVKIKSIITFREKCLDSYNKRIETEIIKSIKNIDIEKRFI